MLFLNNILAQIHTSHRYLIQSESHTVVHPPAGSLLPWCYQLDMFHRTVCGWISHTRINSTFKNALLSTPALGSHQSYTPTHIMLCLVQAIMPKHWHINQSLEGLAVAAKCCMGVEYVFTHDAMIIILFKVNRLWTTCYLRCENIQQITTR